MDISMKFVPGGPIWNKSRGSIGPGNGMDQNSPQAIVRTYWRIYASPGLNELTHWARVTHICVSKLYHHWFR